MSLTRTETVEGLVSDWATVEELIRGLSDEDMERGSRCEGWTVRDLAAHIVGSVSELAAGTPGQTTGEQQAAERSSHSGVQLADELHVSAEIAAKLLGAIDDHFWAQPSPAAGFTVRQGVEVLWVESFVHEDDIRHALGLPARPSPGRALEVALRHVAEEMGRRGWDRTTLELDGVRPIRIGPGGDAITGDPHRFLLAATGRIAPSEVGLDEKVNIYRS